MKSGELQENSSDDSVRKAREKIVTDHCGLLQVENRISRFDAYHPTIAFSKTELKLIHAGRDNVGTKTRVSLKTLADLESMYWLVCEESNTKASKYLPEIKRLWIIHPYGLQEPFGKLRMKLQKRQNMTDKVIPIIQDALFTDKEIQIVKYLLNHGNVLDNPCVSKKYFEDFGESIDPLNSEIAQIQIKEYMMRNPLDTVPNITPSYAPKENMNAYTFFDFE